MLSFANSGTPVAASSSRILEDEDAIVMTIALQSDKEHARLQPPQSISSMKAMFRLPRVDERRPIF